jgi:ureidoglycolate lyase
MDIITQPLTPETFAPYGQVFTAPQVPGRVDNPIRIDNRRSAAAPWFILVKVAPSALPLTARMLERHRFSSQAFVPMKVSRYLVVVAPDGADGGPELTKARAFIAGPGQGVNYNPDVWHHPVTVLDRPADFCVLMWNDGSPADTEYLELSRTFVVREGR